MSYAPAFKTGTGWDFATGIGTVNVYNLVTNWASSGGGNASLTVSVTGSGTVASNPSGISCPSTCSHTFTGGSQVTLTPTPVSGWAFSSWGGACSGSGGCTVTMNAAESVTATFVQNVNVVGERHRQRHGDELAAGDQLPDRHAAPSFAPGTQVTLTATPANGWGFQRLGRRLQRRGNCVVTMNAAQSVTATFAQTQYTLNVSVDRQRHRDQLAPGISCPSMCTMNYSSGTSVMLTATPTGGTTFNGWGGACSGNGSCLGDHELDRKRHRDIHVIRRRRAIVANLGLGDAGQRFQSMHPHVALPDLRRGAGPDHRRRRNRCRSIRATSAR